MAQDYYRSCPLCNKPIIEAELPTGAPVRVTQRTYLTGTRYKLYERGDFRPHVIRTRMSPGFRLHTEVCPSRIQPTDKEAVNG